VYICIWILRILTEGVCFMGLNAGLSINQRKLTEAAEIIFLRPVTGYGTFHGIYSEDMRPIKYILHN
jgi:hypothetical protein